MPTNMEIEVNFLEKSYFDIFLSFYSPKYTTEIKMELKLFPMIQFKFNI